MRELWYDKKKRYLILLSSFTFLLITHSYRWVNTMYSHDSLMVVQNDWYWQVSIGRIFNPLYVKLRGQILAPMNVALFACLFLIFSVFFVIQILHLKKTMSIVLCCGFLTTFETITFVNAGFLQSMDLDMLALLFSVIAAWFFTEKKSIWGYIAGILSVTLMLGLFQSYIEVTIMLICLSLLRDVLDGGDAKKLFLKGLRCVALLILGGILYYICLKAALHITGVVATENSTNGLVKMKTLTVAKVFSLAKDAWEYTLKYVFIDSMIFHKTISKWVYRLLGLISFSGIIWISWKKQLKIGAASLLLFLLLVMPLGGNIVYVLSLGFKHSLMNYSFVFFSLLFVLVFDQLTVDNRFLNIACRVVPLLCAVLLLNHVLFANQWYIRTDLYSRAGMSVMTRLVSDMEEIEGYEVGKTPVLILGHIDDNPASFWNDAYEIASDFLVGTSHHHAVSYYQTYKWYFENILGYSANLVPLKDAASYLDDPRCLSMPIYPAQGGIQIIDGVMVIRLSEDLRPENFRWS